MDHTPGAQLRLGDAVLSTLSLVVVAWLVLTPSEEPEPGRGSGWGRA